MFKSPNIMYAERCGKYCREEVCKEKIISLEQKLLTKTDVINVIEFFNGKIKETKFEEILLKNEENEFTLFLNAQEKIDDFEYSFDNMTALKGLGLAYFDLENMNVTEKKKLKGYSKSHYLADYFAMTFLMPDELMKKSITENSTYQDEESDYDKVKLHAIKEEFGVSINDVIKKMHTLGYKLG